MKRCDEEKKKPRVLNKAFVMDDRQDRIDKVNQKVNSMRNHCEIHNS
jgi:hypothetical protein